MIGKKLSEAEIRTRLKNGEMVDKPYTVIFRPVGSTQAVIEIAGTKFTVDDSTRPLCAGMVHDGNKRKSQLPGLTQGEVTEYFNSFPRLGKDDFAPYERKHIPRPHGNQKFNNPIERI